MALKFADKLGSDTQALDEQSAQSCKLEGDRTVIVFFTLDFKQASDIPTTLSHTGATDRRLSDKDVKKAGRVNQASNKIRQPAQEIADDEVTIAKTGSKL